MKASVLVSSLELGHFWPKGIFLPGVVSRKRGVTGCGDQDSKEIPRGGNRGHSAINCCPILDCDVAHVGVPAGECRARP